MNLMACWLQIDFDLLQLSKLKNNGSNDCGSLNNNNSVISHSLQSRYKNCFARNFTNSSPFFSAFNVSIFSVVNFRFVYEIAICFEVCQKEFCFVRTQFLPYGSVNGLTQSVVEGVG